MAYKSGNLTLGAFVKTDLEGNWHSQKNRKLLHRTNLGSFVWMGGVFGTQMKRSGLWWWAKFSVPKDTIITSSVRDMPP